MPCRASSPTRPTSPRRQALISTGETLVAPLPHARHADLRDLRRRADRHVRRHGQHQRPRCRDRRAQPAHRGLAGQWRGAGLERPARPARPGDRRDQQAGPSELRAAARRFAVGLHRLRPGPGARQRGEAALDRRSTRREGAPDDDGHQRERDLGSRSPRASSMVASSAACSRFGATAWSPAQRSLGLLATSLATAFNRQHALGIDLEGALGQGFFTLGGAEVEPPTSGVTVADRSRGARQPDRLGLLSCATTRVSTPWSTSPRARTWGYAVTGGQASYAGLDFSGLDSLGSGQSVFVYPTRYAAAANSTWPSTTRGGSRRRRRWWPACRRRMPGPRVSPNSA